MKTITIATGAEGKGRSFSALLLGHLTANHLWEGGRTETKATRPVWLQFAASEDTMRPFLANIRTGRKAIASEREQFECLRTAGYMFSSQRTSAGVLTTGYIPELFRMDPGMVDPSGVAFVVLPTKAWLATQAAQLDLASVQKHARKLYTPKSLGIESTRWDGKRNVSVNQKTALDELVAELLPLSTLFAAYLDRRTQVPLVQDVRFQLQVLVAFLTEGVAKLPAKSSYDDRSWGRRSTRGFAMETESELGYGEPLVCQASHETIERIMTEEIVRYFEAV